MGMTWNEFEAIGFLIGAKSILRFNKMKEADKSEYILAGTLLSIFIAFICGMFAKIFL